MDFEYYIKRRNEQYDKLERNGGNELPIPKLKVIVDTSQECSIGCSLYNLKLRFYSDFYNPTCYGTGWKSFDDAWRDLYFNCFDSKYIIVAIQESEETKNELRKFFSGNSEFSKDSLKELELEWKNFDNELEKAKNICQY